jgi:hypothetical protein
MGTVKKMKEKNKEEMKVKGVKEGKDPTRKGKKK